MVRGRKSKLNVEELTFNSQGARVICKSLRRMVLSPAGLWMDTCWHSNPTGMDHPPSCMSPTGWWWAWGASNVMVVTKSTGICNVNIVAPPEQCAYSDAIQSKVSCFHIGVCLDGLKRNPALAWINCFHPWPLCIVVSNFTILICILQSLQHIFVAKLSMIERKIYTYMSKLFLTHRWLPARIWTLEEVDRLILRSHSVYGFKLIKNDIAM